MLQNRNKIEELLDEAEGYIYGKDEVERFNKYLKDNKEVYERFRNLEKEYIENDEAFFNRWLELAKKNGVHILVEKKRRGIYYNSHDVKENLYLRIYDGGSTAVIVLKFY